MELPSHDNAATVMLKVTHCLSKILHPLQTVEEEMVQRSETPVTPDDNNISMTRIMFKSIMTKTLEDQKNLADATSAEVAFTEGVKKRSELQTQHLHSSTIEQEAVCYPVEQSPIMPSEEDGLHSVHLLRPRIGNVMGPSLVNNTIPVHSAVKLPVFSAKNGVTDGNKTFQPTNGF